MTEISMRPIGLKLVFGAAVTLLLVSSVRQQWNSSKQKFARQVSSSNDQVSEQVHEGFGVSGDGGDRLQTGDREERIDGNLEDNSSEAKLTNENNDHGNDILAESQIAASVIEQEELREDTVSRDEGQVPQNVRNGNETIGAEESLDNREIASPVNFSTHTSFESQAKINQQGTDETYSEIPDYDSSNDRDPDWRSTKYANALYEDEEENNHKPHLDSSVISENEKVSENRYDDSDENVVQNADSKDASVLSWFGLRNYFIAEVDPGEAGGVLESRQDSNKLDTNLSNDTSKEVSGLDSKSTFLTDHEENGTDLSRIRTYNDIYTATNNTTNNNNTGSQPIETNQLQLIPPSKELPFGINGIDAADYDDFDDEGDRKQTKQTGYTNDPEYTHENSRFDKEKNENDLEKGFSNGREFVPFAEADTHVLRFGEDERETSHVDSSTFQKSDETQQDQQPLVYEAQQPPLLSNSPLSQSVPKSPAGPRLLDLILADNLGLLQSQQFLAKLGYYLHQNIHRIDQDVDPNPTNKTTNTVFSQMQTLISPQNNPNNPLLSKMTAAREFDNLKIPQTEDVKLPETKNNDIYDDNTDNTGTFYDTIHTNGDIDETNDSKDNQNGQAGIYTAPPDPAIYDNPRPLSESEFALFRTQPYRTGVSLTESVSESPAGVKFNEYHSDESNTVPEQQQTNTEITKREDESIPCPRQALLAKTAQPVTALVSFSDSSTVWVRTMLEQLTGIETDSIYNIMAQLKSGNAESVYNMGRKIVIETHMATEKNFDRAVVVIRNPFAVDAQHRVFRPPSVEWQQTVLWNHTYSTWLASSLPLHVITFEDLVESPLTELMKLANFLSTTDMTISYKCAMKVALDPPKVINDVKEITGIYHDDRKRINQNIDYVIQVALKKHSDIVLRLNSYKVLPGT